MSSVVVDDVLEEIFNNLVESKRYSRYKSSELCHIYHCCLVNRKWCKIAIPILWRQPFTISRLQSLTVVIILLSSLDKDKRKDLSSYGIVLPHSISVLFPYFSFLKYLNYSAFLSAVQDYCESFVKRAEKDVSMMTLVLLKYFFEIEVRLLRLTIHTKPSSNYKELVHDQTRWRIENSLHVGTLHSFLPIVKHIDTLRISGVGIGANVLLHSIESWSSSLRHIIFTRVNFYTCQNWTGLAFCRNLKVLEFINCHGITQMMAIPITEAKFANLQKVIVRDSSCAEGVDLLRKWAANLEVFET
ncbi:hypothetical protein G9A89_001305 [Geosiphon pyriformis]|nr:hypothetical protein G9A89_001305 [Geosiphon pyriformis]